MTRLCVILGATIAYRKDTKLNPKRLRIVAIVMSIAAFLLVIAMAYNSLSTSQNPAIEGTVAYALAWIVAGGYVAYRAKQHVKLEEKMDVVTRQLNGVLRVLRNESPAKRRNIPRSLREQVLKRDNYTCLYCGEQGTQTLDPDGLPWHLDHLHPVSKGGTNHPSNLVASCRSCNLVKHDATAAEYMKRKYREARSYHFDDNPTHD